MRTGELSGRRHFVYPQPLLATDLVASYVDRAGGEVRFGVREVALHDIDSDRPVVSYTDPVTGDRHRIECDFIMRLRRRPRGVPGGRPRRPGGPHPP